MTTTTTPAPIATEIAGLLENRACVNALATPNAWNGLDFGNEPHGRIVRVALDDNQVQVYVLEGRAQLLAASATFNYMPASVVAATVAAYLS